MFLTEPTLKREEPKMVPSEGVEPPCLAALGSKPSVSANSTNWAQTITETVKVTVLK